MRVLVCGGRDYNDKDTVYRELDRIAGVSEATPLGQPITIIHGYARGVDLLADGWSADNWAQTLRFPAEWEKHGRAAGPIRNKQMLDEGKPDLVLAFPGGRGTANMIKQAEAGWRARDPCSRHPTSRALMSEILAYIARFLGFYRPDKPERSPMPGLSVEGVEQLISLVGRERVFERAKALGWEGDRPPLWVWNAICQELIAEQPKTPAQIQFIEHVTKH